MGGGIFVPLWVLGLGTVVPTVASPDNRAAVGTDGKNRAAVGTDGKNWAATGAGGRNRGVTGRPPNP